MKIKQTKYSEENPEIWVPSSEEDAKKEVSILIKFFRKYGKVKSVLDIGCGMGRHAYFLFKEGYKCEGVEPHPKMVKYAKQHYPGIVYKVGSMQNINYHKEFDAIICISSIIVFNKSNREVIKTFENFRKALKKNGILIIEIFNSINWIANQSFKKKFVDIDKKHNEKTVIREWINTNNQSYISEREYYDLKTKRRKGAFTKESRMFFPLELKFFLEQAGFTVLGVHSGDSLSRINLNYPKLDKRRLLVIARRK